MLDLVTPSTQHAHKELLHTHPEEFRVVVACRLFDEGTDWVPCSWMHNTDACEQSVTLAVQRFFRPLRQHPDKKVVQIFNYLPGFTTEMTMNEKRQVFSNRFAAFLSCIVTHGEIVPVMVNTKPKTNQGASKKLSLQEVFGDKFPNVMSDMLERYELVEDKEDAAAIEEIADQILFDYDLPDGVDVGNLRDALLTQLCRIAVPNKNLTPSNIEPNGIDANSIRELGFDKVWEKVALVPSVVCFGTDNIDVAMIRELLGIVKETPSLEEIHEGIRVFKQRTGKPPTFHQSEWMIELNRTASAVDKVLRRHYDSTLAREVRTVFGDFNDDLLVKTHDLIREYWSRGIRIGNKYGNLPGIGMSSYALNGRLKNHYNTTLAAEVRTILGPQVKPLSISKVIDVIQQYADQGIHLHRKFGSIPELDMSSYNLADRLKRNSIVTLSELVQSVEDNM